MMSFSEIVNTYGREGSVDVMEKLTHKVDWFTKMVAETNPELADKFLTKVDLLLNPHFTRKTAEYAVSKFENKDGSKGEHWTYEQAKNAMDGDYNPCDWYVTLNMIYSDYYKSGRSDETYISLAKDFLDDIDAPEDKIKRYYLAMRK